MYRNNTETNLLWHTRIPAALTMTVTSERGRRQVHVQTKLETITAEYLESR